MDTYTIQPRIRGVFHSPNEPFDHNKHEVYIKVIDSKGKETKMAKFTDILPKQLTFRVPKSLPKDTYTLEVRSTLGTKELRVGKLSRSLTVK